MSNERVLNEKAEELRARGSAFSRFLGICYEQVCDGQSTTSLLMREDLGNIVGGLHGGAAFTLVDCAMGAAVYSLLAPGERTATLEAKMNFIRPVQAGLVCATAKVLHRGRRTLVLEAQVLQGDKLIAMATGTFAITT